MASLFEQKYAYLPADIDKILEFASENGCSDVFVKVGDYPYLFRYGIMYRLNNLITEVEWNKWFDMAATSEQNSYYVRQKMLDFSYHIQKPQKAYRYRVSAGYSNRKPTMTARMISLELPTFKKLNIDEHLQNLLAKVYTQTSGISLIVGATGSGKSSTFAACINEFSRTTVLRDKHIITLEDPVEYLFNSTQNTRIMQKELTHDFSSFSNGIKQALREHPNIVVVGEARDKETISSLVEASRTGHATFSTFHTSSVADTIARLYSYLTDNPEIMYDLVSNLNFVLAQQLIKGRGGYTLDTQYMFFNNWVKAQIVKAIDNGENVSVKVNQLMANKQHQQARLCEDWKVGSKQKEKMLRAR